MRTKFRVLNARGDCSNVDDDSVRSDRVSSKRLPGSKYTERAELIDVRRRIREITSNACQIDEPILLKMIMKAMLWCPAKGQ